MWLKLSEVEKLGIYMPRWIRQKVQNGEWKSRKTAEKSRNGKAIREVELESLPHELQMKWIQQNQPDETAIESSLTTDSIDFERRLTESLLRYKPDVREAFRKEAMRLMDIVNRHELINPKRIKNNGKHEFVSAVWQLCREAVCSDAVVLSVEPKRGKPISPHTLDGWWRNSKSEGLCVFLRKPSSSVKNHDNRKAQISAEAVEFLNSKWRNYPSPRHLYKALSKISSRKNWIIPSETWVRRKYDNLPKTVSTLVFKGEKEYTGRLAPFYPRSYEDLEALQILCGDHSVRDVFVMMPDGSLVRPWLTMWQDLRTGLIWGWHLDVTPSSTTIALAYANGVQNFGAQPSPRPDEKFKSYLQHDLGKDYRSFTAEGKTINVGKAFAIEGGLKALCIQREIGFRQELGLGALPARGYNAREKSIERTHRDISDFEQNYFESEYCGRDAKNKPEKWVAAWHRHQKLLKKFPPSKHSNREILKNESPFMTFDDYRENLAAFINEYNESEHKRSVLGGATIVPIDEYRRLYTTRYEISDDALALFLMKADARKIGKLGVQMLGGKWFQSDEMSRFKGERIEVRYDDNDHLRIWAVLPDGKIVEAPCINPGPILNPNKKTMGIVKKMEAHERKMGREWLFVEQSKWRGETAEDRVAALINPEEVEVEEMEIRRVAAGGGSIHQFTRLGKITSAQTNSISTEQVGKAEVIDIFRDTKTVKIKEEWED